jgi:hypothetical protein
MDSLVVEQEQPMHHQRPLQVYLGREKYSSLYEALRNPKGRWRELMGGWACDKVAGIR